MGVYSSEVDSCAWHFLLVVRVWGKLMPVRVQDLAPGQGVQLDEVEGNEGLKENPASSRNPKDGTPKVGDSHSGYCVITKLCSLTYHANMCEHCQSIASRRLPCHMLADAICCHQLFHCQQHGCVHVYDSAQTSKIRCEMSVASQAFTNQEASSAGATTGARGQLAAGLLGILAVPVVAWSEYTLKETGKCVSLCLSCK